MTYLLHARPEEIGLDPNRLQLAYNLLEFWTKGPRAAVPGGAILLGRHGKIVPPRFFGRQGPEPDAEPIRSDAMFLMASLTKPLTYLAGLMLVERGLLNLSDPVMRYIPEFAAHHKEEVKVRQLFTHTSGMPDMLENDTELRKAHAPLSKFIEAAIRDTKLLFPAGTSLSYQSMGTLVVAALVQQLSGLSIHDFFLREIFEPLQLRSIRLGSQGLIRARLVRVETPPEQDASFGWNSDYWQAFGAPWGGLFAAPEDYAAICQLMLNDGALGKVRLLSPGMVRMMTTNRLNDEPDLPEPIRRAYPWGLGWRMNQPGTDDSWGDALDRQVFGHTGSTGTMVWMDRERDGFAILPTSAIRAKAPWRLTQLSNIVAAAFV
jgi:CubicO group peptidase (beta-lactamase class C family)